MGNPFVHLDLASADVAASKKFYGVVSILLVAACTRASPEGGVPRPPTWSPAVASSPAAGGALVAFPGAEGFGAAATGGRGCAVCIVTTLASAGAGSLRACLDRAGPRTIVFRTSGVIAGPFEITHGDLTIAGQTSPGGITIQGGLVCDNVYDPNTCGNVILRHLRLRGGAPDSLRLGGTHDVIVDHVSLAAAEDENLEITRSQRITIQHSTIAEPRGDHFKYGGVLINYSKDVLPLGELSIHHTVWNGVAGRLPELSCEDNPDGPGQTNCAGRTLRIDLVNNVAWDALDPIWFNRCPGTNAGNDCPIAATNVTVSLNLIGNVLVRRSSGDDEAPLIEPHVYEGQSRVYAHANVLGFGARRTTLPDVGAAHPMTITVTPTATLVAQLAATAGAFPRDAMDRRLAGYLAAPIDARPPAWVDERGVEPTDAFATGPAPAPPTDADADGMPDTWEATHGLDPTIDDARRAIGCAPGYTAIECYVNELADQLVSARAN
ncbi:MAG: hypothetical protein NT062_03420 [Proteobacteria bacterium]|nr:hypothetical protein [Pseudomonadota bacterium]